MNITDRLRLEVLIREQLHRHGQEFYVALAQILEKIKHEQEAYTDFVPPRQPR